MFPCFKRDAKGIQDQKQKQTQRKNQINQSKQTRTKDLTKESIVICNARQSMTANKHRRDNVQLRQMKQSNAFSVKRCEKKKSSGDTLNGLVQLKEYIYILSDKNHYEIKQK